MRKTVIIMAVMMVAAVILTAALIVAVFVPRPPKDPRFRKVEEFKGGCIYVDTETGIGYGRLYENGEMFVLYNTDGELYRPNGWRDTGE